MNPKRENVEKCGLESINGSLMEPSKVGPKVDTWLGVLNLTS